MHRSMIHIKLALVQDMKYRKLRGFFQTEIHLNLKIKENNFKDKVLFIL